MRFLIAVVALVLLTFAPAYAQDLRVGETYTVAFEPSPSVPSDGLALAYRVYLDGVAHEVPDATPVDGLVRLPMPPFAAAGTYTFRASARWVVTDESKWEPCPAGGCPDRKTPELTVTVGPAAPPDEPEEPGTLQIIRVTTTISLAPTGEIVDVQTRTVRVDR